MALRMDSRCPASPEEIRLPHRGGVGRPGRNTLIWILTFDGPGGFAEKDAAYYDSVERKSLRPDPAPLIEKAETYPMTSALEG